MAQLSRQSENLKFATAPAVAQYTDKGSHARQDLSCFFHPSEPVYYEGKELKGRLGQRPQSGYPACSFVKVLLELDHHQQDTVPIKGGHDWWTLVWNDSGSGLADDFSVWRVKPERIPSGYVCVSPCFFKVKSNGQASWEPPSEEDVQGMVALREARWVTYVRGYQLIKVWDDVGTHASADVSIYTGPDNLGLFAFSNHSPPPAGASFPIVKSA